VRQSLENIRFKTTEGIGHNEYDANIAIFDYANIISTFPKVM
jgi:hypothetical protein